MGTGRRGGAGRDSGRARAAAGGGDAKRLDMGIRLLADAVRGNVEKLAEKITEAKQCQIHVALGFPSWTALAIPTYS
jgi:hypothetical protein